MSMVELPLPIIDQRRCIGCGECIEICPTGAIGQVGDRAALVDPQACSWCGHCEARCPTDAIGLPYLIRFDVSTSPQKT